MTDWLDTEDARAAIRGDLESGMTLESSCLAIFAAIADLPEPSECECYENCRALSDTKILHRIWRIARIVCGKEAQP